MQKKHNEHIEGAIGPADPRVGLDIGVWHMRQIRSSPPQCAHQRLYLRHGLEGYTQVAGNDWVVLNMIWLCAAKVVWDGCVEEGAHGDQECLVRIIVALALQITGLSGPRAGTSVSSHARNGRAGTGTEFVFTQQGARDAAFLYQCASQSQGATRARFQCSIEGDSSSIARYYKKVGAWD
ncbi:hypothetical protein C8J57DRAFT_1228329 [Mycena rebaudengoi]|nr:hypothetical protein C8J57DRAFT_1228329 [Mycena rebaudengoi]